MIPELKVEVAYVSSHEWPYRSGAPNLNHWRLVGSLLRYPHTFVVRRYEDSENPLNVLRHQLMECRVWPYEEVQEKGKRRQVFTTSQEGLIKALPLALKSGVGPMMLDYEGVTKTFHLSHDLSLKAVHAELLFRWEAILRLATPCRSWLHEGLDVMESPETVTP